MKNELKCVICDNLLKGKQLKYCSIKCKNKNHQSYTAQKSRGFQRKIQIIHKLGGKCTVCGYNKNIAALIFHHLNPQKKKFKLDVRSLSNRNIDQINTELKKCKLLCHNCHAEIHYPQHDLT